MEFVYKNRVCFIVLVLLGGLSSFAQQKPMVILTASYNNKQWYERNLDSVFGQRYDNWRLIYVNDCSNDGTRELVQDYIVQHGYQDKVSFIDNKRRRGHLANQYNAIHSCDPREIVIILDGDDWFPHSNVLNYINTTYQNPDVWMTYGQFWYAKRNVRGMCHEVAPEYVVTNKVRDYPAWVLSHLRTFYAGLFQMIAIEDLLYQGSFYPMFADGATMYPMFEMAAERAKFIPDILCVYNDANQLSFSHDRADQQMAIRMHVLANKRYQRLEHAVFLN